MKVKPNIPLSQVEKTGTVQHWGFFSKEEIAQATADGSLLMLDIDFGRTCSLRCPWCFRRRNKVDMGGMLDMEYGQLISVLAQARDLGLRSVKICGAGEPFENPRLLELTRDLTRMDIGLAIFTKGHVIGDDGWSRRVFGMDGVAVCDELHKLKTSVMLSYPSFDPQLFCRLVGDKTGEHAARVKLAAERLAAAGFNSETPTRLAFVHAPIVQVSIGGAFEVYQFARERNILPVLAFSMVSGEQITGGFLARHDPTTEEKLSLFRAVYQFNLDRGIQTKGQLLDGWVSCMPGIHPCNQIAVGLYLTANGNVVRCPGDSGAPLGNVQREKIADIWTQARQWQFSGRFNCGCPYKDGRTIPWKIYEEIEKIIKS